jgi:spore coat protein U-like protein
MKVIGKVYYIGMIHGDAPSRPIRSMSQIMRLKQLPIPTPLTTASALRALPDLAFEIDEISTAVQGCGLWKAGNIPFGKVTTYDENFSAALAHAVSINCESSRNNHHAHPRINRNIYHRTFRLLLA